jgi:hypothetical protein
MRLQQFHPDEVAAGKVEIGGKGARDMHQDDSDRGASDGSARKRGAKRQERNG